MNNRILKGVTAGLLSAAMLSACSGGSGSSTPPVPTGGTQSKTTTVKLTFGVSAKKTSVSRTKVKRGRNINPGSTISPSAVALGVSVVAHGASFPAMRTPQFAVNIAGGASANNVSCTAAASDGSYDCTLLIAAPVGYDDIQISAWDGAVDAAPGAGSGGTFNGGQNLVAYGTGINQLIQLNQNNAINVPLGGIVYSAAIVVSPNSLVAGAPSGTGSTNPTNPTVTVLATDIDGNLITGTNQYYDANGILTTLQVTEAAQALSGFSQTGTTEFGGSSATAYFNTPADSATISYDGNPISKTTLTLSATGGTPAGTFANSALSFTNTQSGGIGIPGTPVVTEFAADGIANQSRVNQVAAGPDGNIWYTEPDTNKVIRMTPAGAVLNTYDTWNGPNAIAAGADGDVWYSTTDGHFGKIDPASGSNVAFGGLSSPISRLVVGPDGNMYGVEYAGDKVVRIAPATDAVSEYAMTTGSGPTDLTVGSDGNIWFVENTTSEIGQFNITTTGINEYAVTGQTGPGFNSIVSGTDGNLWVLESSYPTVSNSVLFSVAPGAPGTTVSACTIAANGNQYQFLTQGPDTNFYMTQGGLGNGVARVSTGCSVLPFNNGITTAGSTWLVTGPSPVAPYTQNAAVWFAEATPGKVGAIQP